MAQNAPGFFLPPSETTDRRSESPLPFEPIFLPVVVAATAGDPEKGSPTLSPDTNNLKETFLQPRSHVTSPDEPFVLHSSSSNTKYANNESASLKDQIPSNNSSIAPFSHQTVATLPGAGFWYHAVPIIRPGDPPNPPAYYIYSPTKLPTKYPPVDSAPTGHAHSTKHRKHVGTALANNPFTRAPKSFKSLKPKKPRRANPLTRESLGQSKRAKLNDSVGRSRNTNRFSEKIAPVVSPEQGLDRDNDGMVLDETEPIEECESCHGDLSVCPCPVKLDRQLAAQLTKLVDPLSRYNRETMYGRALEDLASEFEQIMLYHEEEGEEFPLRTKSNGLSLDVMSMKLYELQNTHDQLQSKLSEAMKEHQRLAQLEATMAGEA